RAAAPRPAPKARGQGSVVSGTAPGPLLRVTAVSGAVATAVVVGAAAVSSGEAHKGFALIALPLLAAVAAAALWTYPRLVAPATIAFLLMLAAIASGGLVAAVDGARWATWLHVAYAAAAFAASPVSASLS